MSVLVRGRLISYINIYHLFAEHIISNRFLSSLERSGVFVFGGETWHLRKRRWRNLAEAPSNTHNKRSLFRTSPICHRHLAVGISQQVKEYKHTHTHAHTRTHTHTHTDTHTLMSNKIMINNLQITRERVQFLVKLQFSVVQLLNMSSLQILLKRIERRY